MCVCYTAHHITVFLSSTYAHTCPCSTYVHTKYQARFIKREMTKVIKVQYRKQVHHIDISTSSSSNGGGGATYRSLIAAKFRIPESRMKILYRGKLVKTSNQLEDLVTQDRTLYLIGTTSKEQLDANIRCKWLRRRVFVMVMAIFQLSLVQIPFTYSKSVFKVIKLFFVSMFIVPSNVVEDTSNNENYDEHVRPT